MTAPLLLDTAKLLERLENDKELMEEIFVVFISEAPERRANLEAAVSTLDLDRLTQLAHALKGASGTLVADPLREASAALEAAARGRDAEAAVVNTARVIDLLERTTEFMAEVEVGSL